MNKKGKKKTHFKTGKIHFVLPLYLIPQRIKLNPVNSSFSLLCRSDMFFWFSSILQSAEETKGGRAVAIAMTKSLLGSFIAQGNQVHALYVFFLIWCQ